MNARLYVRENNIQKSVPIYICSNERRRLFALPKETFRALNLKDGDLLEYKLDSGEIRGAYITSIMQFVNFDMCAIFI